MKVVLVVVVFELFVVLNLTDKGILDKTKPTLLTLSKERFKERFFSCFLVFRVEESSSRLESPS
jgi:hypothetical protein